MDQSDNKSSIQPPSTPRELTDEERRELREGMSLYEMVSGTAGWQIVKDILTGLAYHSWVDPREVESKEAWEWRELNAFHAANNAKELLRIIQEKIDKSSYLQKLASGEVKNRSMRL